MTVDRVEADEQLVIQAAATHAATHLRRNTARGAVVSIGGQVANFVLRTGSMIVLARLIDPKDFGLVGMVLAVTGFLSLFKDAGLSMATVQKAFVTDGQASTLFWVNIAVGFGLTLACIALAPALARFYGDPRLVWITIALSTGFLFGGAVAQHRAMLQRGMRFGAMALIEVSALVLSTVLGVTVALRGGGYWALVVIAVSQPALVAIGTWIASGWLPSWPRRQAGVKALLMFGGAITLNNLIVYIAYNADKVLLGRFWGAEALGLYGRAYQLTNVANESLLATIGLVAFPALSRLQDNPERLRSYFVKGYGLFLSMIMPVTVCFALFSDDIIVMVLGPKWRAAAPIFRWLAPTTMAFAFTHPFSWLMLATGRTGRCLKIALAVTPVLIVGYALGLHYGPIGVAGGFSISMALVVVPVIMWAKHGTLIRAKDVFDAVTRPAVCIAIAVAASYAAQGVVAGIEHLFIRTLVECAFLMGVYLLALLFIMRQLPIYAELLREIGFWPLRPATSESVQI